MRSALDSLPLSCVFAAALLIVPTPSCSALVCELSLSPALELPQTIILFSETHDAPPCMSVWENKTCCANGFEADLVTGTPERVADGAAPVRPELLSCSATAGDVADSQLGPASSNVKSGSEMRGKQPI